MGTGRVVVQQWVSLDGLAAGPGGEADVLEGVDAAADERSQDWNSGVLAGDVTVLLGRRTYEQFVTYWPTATESVAPAVNAARTVVASRTLDAAPWGDFEPATVVPDAVTAARELCAAGATVLVWGSLDLVGVLCDAGLVDELDLFVTPVLLGVGRRLLPERAAPVRLRQLASEDWGGITHVRYAVVR